mmetsp:Transcript_7417/g.11725  ORF Transcript_7417/g.11725 Transcript_7417/m.11725 type:complete len:251 (-) Transcript_7417:215-967(-)
MPAKKRKREEEDDTDDSSGSDSDSSEERVKKHKKKKEKKDKKKKKKDKKKDRKKKKKKKKKDRKKEKPEHKEQHWNAEDFKNDKIGVPRLIAQDGNGVCEKTILKFGTGRKPEKGQEVALHCVGTMMKSRKKFWNTREKKGEGHKVKPYKFRVGTGKVIKGWDAGVQAMRLGETAKIVVTGTYAYGLKGNPKWGIPPNCDLEFEMELLHIGDEIILPDKYELMKQKVANKHTFLERDNTGFMLQFRSAPF